MGKREECEVEENDEKRRVWCWWPLSYADRHCLAHAFFLSLYIHCTFDKKATQ